MRRTFGFFAIFSSRIRSTTMRSSSASTSAGGRLGMNLARLPGLERSSAPDWMSAATGESLLPSSLSDTSLSVTAKRSSCAPRPTSSTRIAAAKRMGVPIADTLAPILIAGGCASTTTSFGAFLLSLPKVSAK